MYYSLLYNSYIYISVFVLCGQVFSQINPYYKLQQPNNPMFLRPPQIRSDSIGIQDARQNPHGTRAPLRESTSHPKQLQVFHKEKHQMTYQSNVPHSKPTIARQQIIPRQSHVHQKFAENIEEVREFQTVSPNSVNKNEIPLRNTYVPKNRQQIKSFQIRSPHIEEEEEEEEEPQNRVEEKRENRRHYETVPTNVREETRNAYVPKNRDHIQPFMTHSRNNDQQRQHIVHIPEDVRRYRTPSPNIDMNDNVRNTFAPKNREQMQVQQFETHSTNVDDQQIERTFPKPHDRLHRVKTHSTIDEEEPEEQQEPEEPEEPVKVPENRAEIRRYPTHSPLINAEPQRNVYIPNNREFENIPKVNQRFQNRFTQSESEPQIQQNVEIEKYYPIENERNQNRNQNRGDRNMGRNIQNYPQHNVQHAIERQHNIPHQSISLRPMPLVFRGDRGQQEFPFQKNHIIKQTHQFDPFQRKQHQNDNQPAPNQQIEPFKRPFKKEVALIREITEIMPPSRDNFDLSRIATPSPPDLTNIYSPFEQSQPKEQKDEHDKSSDIHKEENFFDDEEVPPERREEERERERERKRENSSLDNDESDESRDKSKFEREVDVSADELEKYFDREFANENEKDEEAQKKIDFEENESNQQVSKKKKDDDLDAELDAEPELEYKTGEDFLKNHDDFLSKIDRENDKFRKETDDKEEDDNDKENESEEDKKVVDDGEKELDESDKKEDEEEEIEDSNKSKKKTNKDDSSASDSDEPTDSTTSEESKDKTKDEAEDDETESESKEVTEKEAQNKSNKKEDQQNEEKQENDEQEESVSKDEEEKNEKTEKDETNDSNEENNTKSEECVQNKCDKEVLKEEESKESKTKDDHAQEEPESEEEEEVSEENILKDNKSLSSQSSDGSKKESDEERGKGLAETTTESVSIVKRREDRVNSGLNRVSKTETHGFAPYFIDLKRINTKTNDANILKREKRNNLRTGTNSQRVATTSGTTSSSMSSSARMHSSQSEIPLNPSDQNEDNMTSETRHVVNKHIIRSHDR